MKIISTNDVQEWYHQAGDLAEFTHTLGTRDTNELRVVDIPLHLQFAIEKKSRENPDRVVPANAFDSISFYSLCRGLFLPLSNLQPDRIGQLFGITISPSPQPLSPEGRGAKGEDQPTLIRNFLKKDIGLSVPQKIGCILGDPYLGRRSTFRRDSLVRLLRSLRMMPRTQVLDRLTKVGDVAVLFAEAIKEIRSDPPLTSLEVLETLRFLPEARTTKKFEVMRSLMDRCGKMESYFLSKLVMRNAGFGFDYQGPLLVKVLAEHFKVDAGQLEHAMALTDPLKVTRVLSEEGAEGLRAIQLRPLSPVRPALAGGAVEDIKKYPVWVERKYDGIRLLVHKATDSRGAVLCGAYTRNRGDWLELIPGMTASIRMLPAQSAIVDGELFGFVMDIQGARPASVYEVHTFLQGEPVRAVQLKFAAFDLLYLNGQDLTRLPLSQRRQALTTLVAPFANFPMPLPFLLSEGLMAENREDLNRLFHHFRAQGYEGIIAKDWHGSYHLAARDPAWVKRKPEITLDLVLLAGVFSVTTKESAGKFGSYVIGARNAAGGFDDVGDVAGVDKARDLHIQSEVMRLGLLTGRRIERPSSSGVRPGLEFRPALVVTVKFEGIVQHQDGRLSLRDPKIAVIRSDKTAFEADEVAAIEKLYLDQRIG